jgi:hypothetical protein
VAGSCSWYSTGWFGKSEERIGRIHPIKNDDHFLDEVIGKERDPHMSAADMVKVKRVSTKKT